MTFEINALPYAYDALEPWIDEATMKVHHDKHHQAYCDKLNAAVKGTEFEDVDAEEILMDLDSVPQEILTAVRNHGGGFVNHNMFWEIMSPDGGKCSGRILDEIEKGFGSLEEFKAKFKEAALGQFGSGWAWLVVNSDEKLEIVKTGNQDNPLSSGKKPILCLDVWEHAYYLKYQNKRADYVDAWWNVVNWAKVEELFFSS